MDREVSRPDGFGGDDVVVERVARFNFAKVVRAAGGEQAVGRQSSAPGLRRG